jgi:hypothetical protein
VATIAISKNFLWRNLRRKRHIALSFDSGYATRGIDYAEKSFMKLATAINVLTPFFVTERKNKSEHLSLESLSKQV